MSATAPENDMASRAAVASTAPAKTHGARRPKREVVRSERAPKSGLATKDTAAPQAVTRERMASLLGASILMACWPINTLIGPKKAALMPTFTNTRPVTHRAVTFCTGSASAAVALSGEVPPGGDGFLDRLIGLAPPGAAGWRWESDYRGPYLAAGPRPGRPVTEDQGATDERTHSRRKRTREHCRPL